jgi:hypothetical protein
MDIEPIFPTSCFDCLMYKKCLIMNTRYTNIGASALRMDCMVPIQNKEQCPCLKCLVTAMCVRQCRNFKDLLSINYRGYETRGLRIYHLPEIPMIKVGNSYG